jgi:hypothetical protein
MRVPGRTRFDLALLSDCVIALRPAPNLPKDRDWGWTQIVAEDGPKGGGPSIDLATQIKVYFYVRVCQVRSGSLPHALRSASRKTKMGWTRIVAEDGPNGLSKSIDLATPFGPQICLPKVLPGSPYSSSPSVSVTLNLQIWLEDIRVDDPLPVLRGAGSGLSAHLP